jgi:hypothetical protein
MIKFYKVYDRGVVLPYGCFSNFSPHKLIEDGIEYKTSEHYYQSKKFLKKEDELEVINSATPSLCAKIGRDREKTLREDWEEIKDDIMYNALKLKFSQNFFIKNILLSTAEEELIEDSPVDSYWGCGSDGLGKNMLGKLLMKLRQELREME